MKRPKTRYAKSGDVHIAYQVVGEGPLDLVFVHGFVSNLDLHWEDPGFAHLLWRLGGLARVIIFDKRGTGLSDPVRELPGLRQRMDDLRAVMDAAGSERAALFGASEGGPLSILFAATWPERTRALLLYGAYAHFHSAVLAKPALAAFLAEIERGWGSGASLPRFAPGLADNPRFRDWWARFERHGASPAAALALARMNAAIDVRPMLAAIRTPTLVLHRRDDARVKFAAGRALAAGIPGAKFVELPGRDHPVWVGDVDRVVDEIEAFLRALRAVKAPRHAAHAARATAATPALSPREREVLAMVADGLSNPAIAAQLGLSAHTVKRHVANILTKLDLPTRAAAAAYAARHGG